MEKTKDTGELSVKPIKRTQSSKKRTTISIDKDVLKRFKEYCRSKGMKLSPKIEIFMIAELKHHEKSK